MRTRFKDKRLQRIKEKIDASRRLDAEDGRLLYESNDIVGIGRLADRVRRNRHGKTAYFVYNQHINYTNICINRCRFCAYSRSLGEEGAFVLSAEDIRAALERRRHEPITEIHMVGGLHPSLPFDHYLELLDAIHAIRPDATIKAFTAVEIDYLARLYDHSLEETISRLKTAGLGLIPGGGAEVMSERIHQRLFPRKIGKERWLEVMAALHAAGLKSNATMLYGHIETTEERVAHLLELRQLQDQTGGFSAFIPLAFHSENTELSDIPATTAFEDLKNVAIARLILDNFDHIKAYWVMIGEKLAQTALSFGADDLDGTIMEEKITHMAGARSAKGLSYTKMKELIGAAGYTPVERDAFYQPLDNGY